MAVPSPSKRRRVHGGGGGETVTGSADGPVIVLIASSLSTGQLARRRERLLQLLASWPLFSPRGSYKKSGPKPPPSKAS